MTADPAIDGALTALDHASKQFTRYAEHHRRRGDEVKAHTNYEYAVMCDQALAHLKLAAELEAAPRRIWRCSRCGVRWLDTTECLRCVPDVPSERAGNAGTAGTPDA